MRLQILIALCSAGLGLTACGKDDKKTEENAPAPAPSGEASADTKVAVAAASKVAVPATEVPKEAAAGTEAAAQCQALLDSSWKAAQPALALAGVDPTTVEKNYVENKYFIKNCVALAPEALECLTKSETPLTAIADCKTNDSAEKGKKVHMSTIFPSAPRPEAIPEEEQAKRLAAAVGTWKNEFKSIKKVTTWKINKNGEVKQTSTRDGKAEDPKDYTIKFERPDQATITSGGSSSQFYGYLPVNAKTMYLNNNLAYGAFPVENDKDFILPNRSERIVYKDGTCNAVTEKGLILDATCTWGKKGKVKTFDASYQIPGRLKRDGSPSPTAYKYHMIANHLVDERQADISKFVKK